MSLFHSRLDLAGYPRIAGAVFSVFFCFHFSLYSQGGISIRRFVRFVVPAFPPSGLPTGSKADVSFETTGALNVRPSPFGDLALASWQ
jgi:hypothetical protein